MQSTENSTTTAAIAAPTKQKQTPVFEIISAHIAETEGSDKKYVAYTLQIRHVATVNDDSPAVLVRRYTDFYNLYTELSKNYTKLMPPIAFPKKVLIGNFDNKVISERSTGFEVLLKHILLDPTLMNSTALLNFLQTNELKRAKEYLMEKEYNQALPLLENNFKLLNKIYTDRSSAVLLSLCRLLGCCILVPGSPNAERWADIALHRYESVCDSDLLELYMPLLHVCTKIWWQTGRNITALETRLLTLRKQGIRFNETSTLLEAVDTLEQKLLPPKS